MRLWAAVGLAALLAAGCAPTLVGVGNPDQFAVDRDSCVRGADAPWYGWIPDPLGALSYIAEGQCMRAKGYVRDSSKFMGWRLARPGE